MTAPLAVSQRFGDAVGSQLSIAQSDALRALLLAQVETQTATLARRSAAMTAGAPGNTTGLARAMEALQMYAAREAIEEIEGALARIDAGGYGTCGACDRPIPLEHLEAVPQARYCAAGPTPATPSAGGRAGPRLGPRSDDRTGSLPSRLRQPRGRRPSATRSQESPAGLVCPRCGSTSTTAADAPDAVRWIVALAGQLLREDPQHEGLHPGGSPEQLAARLQRVARLRRELHVTANRVARFGVDEHPILDPVQVSTPIVSSAGLAPGRLLFQLDLAAGRLVALLDVLSADDWTRAGQMGDRLMTLGELVERVLHTSAHDILDLLPAAPERVAIPTDERSRRDRRPSPRPRSSLGRKVDQGATAS